MKKDNSIETYAGYGLDDFLTDDNFQEWVKKDLPKDREFWQKFINAYPDKEKEVGEAYKLLSRLKFVETPLDQARYRRIWENIQTGAEASGPVIRRMSPVKRWLSVAAVIIVLFSLGMWWLNARAITIQTRGADVRKLALADQSSVTLNANSKLTYRKNFNSTNKREVWLEGEAFFDVTHFVEGGAVARPFIVHMETADVDVLGTGFNVKVRGSVTSIMLAHGSVRVRLRNESHDTVLLKPGEMLEFTSGRAPILHKGVDSLSITAWRQQRFVFSNTPLDQAIQQIEDFYGCTITVKDSSLLGYRVTASVAAPPAKDLETALSDILNMKVSRKGDVLEITGVR